MIVNNNHWGVLVASRMAEGVSEMNCGNSLRITYGTHRKNFLSAVIGFTLKEKVSWTYGHEKYVLDILNFTRQSENNSCVAYCLAFMSHVSQTSWCIPAKM